MLRHWRVLVGVGFLVFVVVLIVIVNARELEDDAKRRFTASLDGAIVSIGEDYYTCEHHLKMEDPCDPEVYFSARDPKRDGVLRFTIIDKQKVPAGHFLEPYADWEEAQTIYEKAARQRELSHQRNDG